MDFFEWSGHTKESLENDERARIAKAAWDAAIKNHEPRIEWDGYAKNYVIYLENGRCLYWNPEK